MSRSATRWLPGLLILGAVLYTLSIYSSLPATMPTHWGVDGHPNAWASTAVGAWLVPAMMASIYFISLAVPKRVPALELIVMAVVTFEAVVQYAVLNIALGHAIPINTIVYVGVAAIFVITGFGLITRVR